MDTTDCTRRGRCLRVALYHRSGARGIGKEGGAPFRKVAGGRDNCRRVYKCTGGVSVFTKPPGELECKTMQLVNGSRIALHPGRVAGRES